MGGLSSCGTRGRQAAPGTPHFNCVEPLEDVGDSAKSLSGGLGIQGNLGNDWVIARCASIVVLDDMSQPVDGVILLLGNPLHRSNNTPSLV